MRYKLQVDRTPSENAVEFTAISAQETSRREELKQAGIAAKPIHPETIPPCDRYAAAEKLVGFILKRIQNPKHGETFFLSQTDKDEATQAGFCACVESGFFAGGKVTSGTFKAIRNAMQGRDCLRMRCAREIATPDIALVSDAAGIVTETRTFSKLAKKQVAIAREVFRVMRKALAIDKSKKALARYKSNSRFFVYSLCGMTHKHNYKGVKTVCAASKRSRITRFISYLQAGNGALLKPANLGEEIMQALRDRANGTKISLLTKKLETLA
jgi:hypothetical protein